MPKSLILIQPSPERHWVGDGFPVRNVFGYNDLGKELLSPWLMFDYAAPYSFHAASQRRGVGVHPHRGFETVTVVYEGELEHRDSGGGGGRIGPGDVQWMTAANGIVHEEFHSSEFTRTGGVLHMAQLWVNLPRSQKRIPPAYQGLLDAEIPTAALPGGVTARLIAGAIGDTPGAARTATPMILWDVKLPAGSAVTLPAEDGWTLAVFVIDGEARAADGRTIGREHLGVYSREGADATVSCEAACRLLVLGGRPIAEPVVGYGPFVMNSREEILEAFQDYEAGRMGQLA